MPMKMKARRLEKPIARKAIPIPTKTEGTFRIVDGNCRHLGIKGQESDV